jgi:hypothetical protein
MVVILSTQKVEKSLLEIYRSILSTDFLCVLKMHSGELKMRFLPTAAIHIVWYILIFFPFLEVSKCDFIWNMFYIPVPLICFKSYPHPHFDCSRLHLSFLSDILTRSLFWGPKIREIILEISRFNQSTDFGGILKCILASWKSVLCQPLKFT